jgi:hypothetical protein
MYDGTSGLQIVVVPYCGIAGKPMKARRMGWEMTEGAVWPWPR